MPWAARRPCGHPGCGEYAVHEGRCEEHRRDLIERRGKTAQRGYDAIWRNFRAWFLRRHPVCVGTADPVMGSGLGPPAANWLPFEMEMRRACGRAATQVHHIKKLAEFPALRCVETNCLPQCDSCHATRTRRGE